METKSNKARLTPLITKERNFSVTNVLDLYCQFRHYFADGDFVYPEQYVRVILAMEHWATQKTSELQQSLSALTEENERLKAECTRLQKMITGCDPDEF